METFTLGNGVVMPAVGFGTFDGDSGVSYDEAVEVATDAGYRLIDTAASYGNQAQLGAALKKTAIRRDELFLTSKVANSAQGYEGTLADFQRTTVELATDYLDLYLVHWPKKKPFFETWRAMEQLYREGRVRAIGVSNFEAHHMDRLLTRATVAPAIDQVETHPYFNQHVLRDYLSSLGVQMQAWSPLGQGLALTDATITAIAQRYGVTAAQIVLRWQLQHGVAVIPKSSTPSRIRENIALSGFALTPRDMTAIDALQRGERILGAPDANYDADLW